MQRVRQDRVRELIKRELGEIIRREIPIAEGGVISVNDVGLARDMRSAKIFVSVIGTPEQKAHGERLLFKNTIPIQNLLGQKVTLRNTPLLMFIVGDSIAHGDRVLQIIDELEHGTGAP